MIKKLLFFALGMCLTLSSQAQADLVITEISYNPAESGVDSTEFIEIFNNGLTAVDMLDYTFTEGVTFTFPAFTLAPGAYVVVASDPVALENTYGFAGAFDFGGGLGNNGELIELQDAAGLVVDAVDYDDGGVWPSEADQGGYTLVLCDADSDNNDGANWTISGTDAGIVVNSLDVFGSPGMEDGACVACVETTATIDVDACDTYTVPSGDETYTETGMYMDTIPNMAGCDSVLTINLTINEATTSDITVIQCDADYVAPSGAVYTMTGIYTDVILNEAGCDSTITIDLTINESTVASVTEVACDEYTAPSGAVYTETGIYTDIIENEAGCDSTITIDLTINVSTTAEVTVVLCDGEYTAPSGAVYTETGIYTDVIENEAGCDSTITIDLTINESTTSDIAIILCDADYTAPSGAVYTMTGIYTDVIENEAGCDSTITIDLTINESTVASITEIACDEFTAPSGTVYTETGIYTDVIENEAGCDSTITIDLTINASTESEVAIILCDGEYTAPSGAVYTETGIYTDVIENEAGCDSTITIDLTINLSTESEIAIILCDGEYTAPSGAVYTETGIYTDVIENEAGCDSTITIDLTISEATVASITEVACDEYTAPSGAVYTMTGVYTDVIENEAGCDSTITIDLTINLSTESEIAIILCDGEYTAPSGTVYTETGIYTDVIENEAGCDSTITIDLTINESTTSTITVEECTEYTSPSGMVYTESGTYTDVIDNEAGCDSTITIDLTIITINTNVTSAGGLLTAEAMGLTYQWVDCDADFAPIDGATGMEFAPSVTGNYAVIITDGECSDTSDCEAVTVIGLDENTAASMQVFPNPSNGLVNVTLPNNGQNTDVAVVNMNGEVVYLMQGVNTPMVTFNLDTAPGLYFVTITTSGTTQTVKLIVQ